MCNCKHSTALGEGHIGYCPTIDEFISVGEGWQTAQDESYISQDESCNSQDESYNSQDESYRTSPMSFRKTFHTPPQRIPPVVPHAPLRQRIARFPELAAGVAIVQRRLDFDDPTYDETETESASYRKNNLTRRLRVAQPSCSMEQSLPRRTRTAPCRKCLRVIINKYNHDHKNHLSTRSLPM
ncbi:hypothetical protein M0802_006207 [Mischocyttarus mexicanus]|nr:hypothetical protein M0802_006207 [Mischocyttarus mexicanus]